MAKALECPACGAKHRLEGLDASETFRCDRCGQKLKIPASVAMAAGADDAGTAASTTAPGAGTGTATAAASKAVAPPPRRAGATATTAVIGASTAAPTKEREAAPDRAGTSPDGEASGARRARPPRRRVKWYWRVVAWIVAVPLGFVLTAWPAYEFGLIRKDDVLDVFVGSGTDRYARLAIVTLLWALVTAILVQLFVEGGRIWADRRRRRRASSPAVTPPRGARATG
jgi:hypothetical protein